jgi:hypothetical protein
VERKDMRYECKMIVETQRGIDHFGALGEDGRIILK